MEHGEILLRAVEPEDLELLYRWENNVEFWTVSNTFAPFSRYTLRRYIENSHKTIFETGQMRLMIVRKGTGEAIGAADIFDFDPYHHRAGVGILIADAGNRRKGYATMAMKALASYCFGVLHLHQLYCNIPASNRPSVDLFISLGFTVSGIRREWLKGGERYEDELFLQLIAKNAV